jgi:hypothetical protein
MKTIEEKNCMIAEFMGGTYVHETNTSFAHVKISGYIKGSFLLHELSYHSSWDWLMPVVEQIDHIEYESERLDIIDNAIKTRVIGDVHKAVCEFIKMYNENK